MNRIKIIKRGDLQSPREALETATEKVNQIVIKPQSGKAVENWIDEWRAAKSKDARGAFAALFVNSASASG